VDQNTKQIHVQGGIVLHALHAVLGPHDLAMSSLGSISDQTLSGALSTATHGSGVTFGNLSSTVTFLDLVLPLPDAPLVRVSRDGTVEEAELFKSALCGLGCVGVIVGVGMQVEKAFKLEEECWTMEFHDFVERWRDIAESGEHVRCWWFPQVGEVKVSRMNRTTKVSIHRSFILTRAYSELSRRRQHRHLRSQISSLRRSWRSTSTLSYSTSLASSPTSSPTTLKSCTP
jgi:L-gulonolactone oxidase